MDIFETSIISMKEGRMEGSKGGREGGRKTRVKLKL